jgi:hypothetical protein
LTQNFLANLIGHVIAWLLAHSSVITLDRAKIDLAGLGSARLFVTATASATGITSILAGTTFIGNRNT